MMWINSKEKRNKKAGCTLRRLSLSVAKGNIRLGGAAGIRLFYINEGDVRLASNYGQYIIALAFHLILVVSFNNQTQ